MVAVRSPSGYATESGPHRLERGQLDVVIVIDGLPLTDLPDGARLHVGATAVLALIASPGTGSIASSSEAEVSGLLETSSPGLVRAEVVDPGEVTVGDAVEIGAVSVPITDVLDLHSFRPDETQPVVVAYLAEARRTGLEEVRIVHGRGRGIQRALIRRVLGGIPGVAGFADAPPTRGGWGATIVRLRPTAGSESR